MHCAGDGLISADVAHLSLCEKGQTVRTGEIDFHSMAFYHAAARVSLPAALNHVSTKKTVRCFEWIESRESKRFNRVLIVIECEMRCKYSLSVVCWNSQFTCCGRPPNSRVQYAKCAKCHMKNVDFMESTKYWDSSCDSLLGMNSKTSTIFPGDARCVAIEADSY